MKLTDEMPRLSSSQVLLQLAAARGMESVCLVSSKEEAALAEGLGAWKVAELKEVRSLALVVRLLCAAVTTRLERGKRSPGEDLVS